MKKTLLVLFALIALLVCSACADEVPQNALPSDSSVGDMGADASDGADSNTTVTASCDTVGHDFSDATCTEAKVCSVCGITEGTALRHDFSSATCTAASTCKICGITRGRPLGHDFSKATCTEAKVCRDCGITEGKALGHDWADATFSTPQTCRRCHITTGEPLELEYTDRREGQLKIRRSMLKDREKELYDQFLPYVLSYTPFVIDCKDMDYDIETLQRALMAIRYDYPETWLYFTDGANFDFSHYTGGDSSDYIVSYGSTYFALVWSEEGIANFDKAVVSDYVAKIDDVCGEIVGKMPKELSTKEKYLWLANYICDITEYEYTFNEKYLYADGPLLYGKGICQSYAFAYQWLCQKAGLWNITCSGMVGGIGHQWNVVMLDDGQTYYMDLTWADTDTDSDSEQYYFMTYEECSKQRNITQGEWIADGK